MSNDASKPALSFFFKPALLSVIFASLFSAGFSFLPLHSFWPVLLAIVVTVWLSIKVAQVSAAHFLKREYASSTLFWYLLVAQLAGGLLSLLLVGLLFMAAGSSFSEASSAGTIAASLFSLLPSALILSLLLRSARNWIPAWRPLSAYWRPFYAGFKFTGLDATPQGPPQSDSDNKPA